jgi:outer membrane protein assembly factor BamB
MSSLAKLKTYAPGIAIVLILLIFVVVEYGVMPARRAAQQAAPPAPAPAAPATPAPADAPAPVTPSAPAPTPAAAAAQEPAPITLAPTGPQPLSIATTWSTYHGGPDLSGYVDIDARQRPAQLWQVLLDGVLHQPPVADARGLYVCTKAGKVVAFDLDGKERWSRQLTRPGEDTPDRVEAPLACFNDTLIASTLSGRVHALHAETGEPRWVYEVGGEVLGGAVLAPPADPAQQQRLYVLQREDGTLHHIDFATGAGIAKGEPISRCDGSPAIGGDLLVFGSCAFSLHVHDAANGALLKNVRLCDDCQVAGGPAVLGDFAYTGSRAGFFYCVNVRTGGIAWTNQDCTGETFTTPAVAAEAIVFGSEDGTLYALDRATGRTLWKHASGGTPTSAVIARDTVLVSVDGALHALALQDGAPLWNHEVSDHIAAPAIINGMIVLGSEDGTLIALGTKPG